MTRTAIESEIHQYIRRTSEALEDCDVERDLIAGGYLDSLLVMDLVCFLEGRYGIVAEPTDIVPDNLRSIRSMADFVVRKTAA
jgi:acyl carrier protein